jgi:hypothetical protein
MDPVEPRDVEPTGQPQGYIVPDSKTVERILAIEAALLQSEGLDPAWRGLKVGLVRRAVRLRPPAILPTEAEGVLLREPPRPPWFGSSVPAAWDPFDRGW